MLEHLSCVIHNGCQVIRATSVKIAYFIGAVTFMPLWFTFWAWFFIELLFESIRFESPIKIVQRLYGLLILAVEVAVGKVRGPSKAALVSASADSDGDIEVLHVSQDWISFKLIQGKPTWYPKVHFIIFPGAFYSPISYAPLARELCKRGSLVSIWNVSFSAAYTSDMKIIQQKMQECPDMRWVLIGHSLGGIQVSKIARLLRDANQIDRIAGLVFLASFPAAIDLAGIELPTLTVHGSNDTVSRRLKHPGTTRHFPKKSEVRTILGANHSQFSSVNNPLPIDGPAEISEEQQLQQTAAVVLDFLARNLAPPTTTEAVPTAN